MKNIIAKVLLGISAMAVAGALSFVPATKAEAAPDHFDYDFTVFDTEQGYYGQGHDITSSVDIDFLSMYGSGDHDSVRTNIFFWGLEENEDFTLTFTLPFAVSQINFLDYYRADEDGYFSGMDGLIYSVSADGSTITISGNTADRGGIDGWYRIAIWAPKSSADLFNEEISNVSDDIIKAAQGLNHDGSENPQKVVFYNCNGAVNYRIIQALAQTQGVTLFYTFEYQGYVFTSAITSEMAAQIFIEGEDWYGPCYIAKYCPTVLVDVVK